MPVFKYGPWLSRVVFQLSPERLWSLLMQTSLPPDHEKNHLIWMDSSLMAPLELSLVLSVFGHRSYGPASPPDCPENHLIWVDSIWTVPLYHHAGSFKNGLCLLFIILLLHIVYIPWHILILFNHFKNWLFLIINALFNFIVSHLILVWLFDSGTGNVLQVFRSWNKEVTISCNIGSINIITHKSHPS